MTATSATTYSSNSVLNAYLTQQAQEQSASAAAAASSSSNSLSGSESTFLQILTTQLQNQDPTDATDPNQFTQELVEFTQAEQQIDTNTDLSTLINLQKSSGGLATTLGYIGQYVEAPTTDQLPLQNGQAELAYTVPAGTSNVTIDVLNSSGTTVATLTGSATAGTQYTTWNGQDTDGTQLPDGTYNFQISATSPTGSAMTLTNISALGLVTGVQSNSDGTASLSLGPMTVQSSAVEAVYTAKTLPAASTSSSSSSS